MLLTEIYAEISLEYFGRKKGKKLEKRKEYQVEKKERVVKKGKRKDKQQE